jgi:hypothetical protein
VILILIYLYISYNLHMILILDRIVSNMYLISSYIQHNFQIPTRPSSYNKYNNGIINNELTNDSNNNFQSFNINSHPQNKDLYNE